MTSPGALTKKIGEFCSTSLIFQNNISDWYGIPWTLIYSSKVKFLYNECAITASVSAIDLI